MSGVDDIKSVLIDVNGLNVGVASTIEFRGSQVQAVVTRNKFISVIFGPTVSDLSRSDWFIDAVNGDDANLGTEDAPLQTHAELVRRQGGPGARVTPPYSELTFACFLTVHLQSSLPSEDPVNIDLIGAPGVLVFYLGGVETVVHTGTITSVVAKTPAGANGGQGYIIGDSSLPTNFWADKLNLRVRITSGPRINTIMWVGKNMGSGTFRASDPSRPKQMDPTGEPYQLAFSGIDQLVPQVGDTYAVEVLRKVEFGTVRYRSEGTSVGWLYPQLSIGELRADNGGSGMLFDTTWIMSTFSCNLRYLSVDPKRAAGFGYFSSNDCHEGWLQILSGTSVKYGGLTGVNSDFPTTQPCRLESLGGTLVVAKDVSVEKGQIMGEDVQISSCSIWDTFSHADAPGGHAIRVGGLTGEKPCSMRIGSCLFGDDANVRVWGNGAAGAGVNVPAGSTLAISSSAQMNLFGAGGQFLLAGSSTLARAWDDTLNSGAGGYTAARAQTWVLLATAVSGGGFGGNAQNVGPRASIVRGN